MTSLTSTILKKLIILQNQQLFPFRQIQTWLQNRTQHLHSRPNNPIYFIKTWFRNIMFYVDNDGESFLLLLKLASPRDSSFIYYFYLIYASIGNSLLLTYSTIPLPSSSSRTISLFQLAVFSTLPCDFDFDCCLASSKFDMTSLGLG